MQVLNDAIIQRRFTTMAIEEDRVVGQFLRCRWFWIDGDTGTFYVYDPSGDYHFVGGKASRIYESEFFYTGNEEGGMAFSS